MNEPDLNYSKGTISISLVHEALLSAQHQGLNTQNILLKSGIPVELMQSGKARVSVSQCPALD